MLLEAIFGIIAISVLFCCCTLCCYVVFHYIFTEEKADVQPETEVWEAKHFYDPLPMATPSPPDTIFKPTPYTFKLQNGNGMYATGLPHAVINPAVLQYPPGHIYDQQRVHQPPPTPPAQEKRDFSREKQKDKSRDLSREERRNERKVKRESSRRKHSKSRSRSPSPHPSPRGPQNVWSTNTEFHQPYSFHPNYHPQNRHNYKHQHSHPPPQHQSQKQYVQLTQEHYPLQNYRQRSEQQRQHYEDEYPPNEEYHPNNHQHLQKNNEQTQYYSRQNSQQFQAFMATSHATNVYTPSTQRKLYRSTTRFKEDIT